jgi:hypothetical protein
VDRIRNKYNPQETQLRAEKLLLGIQKSEHEAWLTHPCTKYLKTIIEAGLDDAVVAWASGEITKNSIEETALTVAKTTGYAEGLNRVLHEIDIMLESSQREEYNEEARYTS